MGVDENTAAEIDFGAVVNAIPGIVWVTQADGRACFVNRSWREYTGLSARDARDQGWQAPIHPDDLSAFLMPRGSKESATKPIDARLRRFDGQYRWFEFHASTIPQSGLANRRRCWFGVCADEGPGLDGRLRRFFDMLPWQAGLLNTRGVSEFSNRQSLNDFGMTQEQLEQWQTSGIIHVDDHARIEAAATALLKTGALFDQELRMLYPDGRYRWTRARCVPVRDAHGNFVRYVSFQIDVDDLKRAEVLLAAEVSLLEMVAKGESLSEVLEALSHHLEKLCTGGFCGVLVVAPDRKHFQLSAGSSLPAAFHEFFESQAIEGDDPCSQTVRDRNPTVITDVGRDPRWRGSAWAAQMSTHGYASCWSTPIGAGAGEPAGAVAVYRCRSDAPTAQEQELVDRFTKIAGIAIDRARADTALQTSETELRETLAQLSAGQRLSHTGSYTSDVSTNRHHWSQEFYRIFEIDPTVKPSIEAVRDRVHPDDLQLFDAQIRRRIEGGDGDFTFRIVTPQGGLKYLRGAARRMDHVDGGPIYMGSIQDITGSKLAEEALTASEAEYRRANMQLTDAHRLSKTGSFTWDVLADKHSWTEEIYRVFDLDPMTKVTVPMLLKAIHAEDLPAVREMLGRAVMSSDFDLSFRVVSGSGTVKHARVIARRIDQGADHLVFMGTLQDVTASKVAEEALNRARAELAHVARVATLSTMTASIAHEVSQPIAGILTNSNTLVRMLAAKPPNIMGASETVGRTIRDANRASEVVKRLRAMFTKKAPTLETVDINSVAREVVALSSGELQRARAVLQMHFAEGLPVVSGDRVQLQQVILNLLLNAADAMTGVEDRPRTLVIRTEYDQSETVKLLVRDSGIGVDPQSVEKLFDAFYTTKAHGMGVGLAISRSIIESHNGRIWAEANDGPGATFGFSIPRASGVPLDTAGGP